jgi:Flp pilus assembly protein TadG
MRGRQPHRDERGAVAVLVAILAVVMFGACALAVDLGSAFVRDREAQKQVDVATISAAAKLPMTSANQSQIVAEVAAQLNALPNDIAGQGTVTSAQLIDLDNANGEVSFPDANTLKVVAPPSTVDFSFTGAMNGADSTDVQRSATVQIRTPIPDVENVLPMWLTAGCMYGEVEGDTDAHADPGASPVYTLNNPKATPGHRTGDLIPASVDFGASPVTVQVPIFDIPSGQSSVVIRFTFGDTQVVDITAPLTPPTTAKSDRTVSVTLTATPSPLDIDITSVPGDWQVWPMVAGKFPKNGGEGKFTVSGGPETGCDDNQRGNFGQLDSPRTSGTLQERYALNVALGLDHELTQFVNAPSFECSADASPVGALIDNVVRNGNNCLYAQPGNDPVGLTNGLLGKAGLTGRLEKPNTDGCTGPAGAASGINNDVLSCFLKPGFTLNDVAQDNPPPDAFDLTIFDSPRFFWVPVVYFETREEKKFLAIKTFAPVFLTDESRTAGATSDNGIQTNGGGQIQQIKLFAFSPRALPVKPNAETVDYDGTRGVLRLIN